MLHTEQLEGLVSSHVCNLACKENLIAIVSGISLRLTVLVSTTVHTESEVRV